MEFTIAIPAFKAIYLEKCIKSVLAQTFKDFEVIILNDCSPNDLRHIVNKFTDNRIKYYENNKNIGALNVVDNWNRCLELSKGKYIALIGDDDTLDPDYLFEFNEKIKKNQYQNIFHCRSWIINECDERIDVTPALPESERIFEYVWHRLSGYRIQFVGDFIYNTEFLRKIGGFKKLPLAWYSDDLTSFKATGINEIINLNKPLFNYRVNQFSITSTGNISNKIKAHNIFFKHIREEFLVMNAHNAKEKVYQEKLKSSLRKIDRKKELEIIDSANLSFLETLIYSLKIKSRPKVSTSLLLLSFVKRFLSKRIW